MRTKKVKWNLVLSILDQIVSTICALIAPRLILRTYGSTYNGVFNSVSQLISFVSILTLGIGGATRAALYKPLADNDVGTISRIVKTNKRYMRKVAIVLVMYIVVLMITYPYISHTELDHFEIAILVGVASLGTLAEHLFGASNRTLLKADQSGYVFCVIDIIAKIIRTIILIILISCGSNVLLVYFASSLVFFISPAVMNYYVYRKYKLDTKCSADNSLIAQKGAAAFHSIANIVHANTDIVILTLFTDAKTISVYSVYNLVVSKLKSIMSVFVEGMEGAFGSIWANKEKQKFSEVFHAYESALFSFAGIAYSCLAVLLIPFIKLYTSGVNDINYIIPELSIMFTITEVVFCVREPYRTVVQATGNYKATKNGALMEAVVNLVISIALVQFIGILGVIVGTLIANLIRTILFAVFTYRRILKERLAIFIGKIVWLIMDMCFTVLVFKMFCHLLPNTSGLNEWLISACVALAVSSVITVMSLRIIYKGEFCQLKRTLLIMLHSKKQQHNA